MTKKFIQSSIDGIRKSACFMALFDEKSWKKDPAPLIQLGLAIMLDKPIAILALQDQKIPENLRKVAFVVEYVDKNNPDSMKTATERILKCMAEKFGFGVDA